MTKPLRYHTYLLSFMQELMGRPVILKWKESGDDKDEVVKAGSNEQQVGPPTVKKKVLKADGEVETVNTEGASVDDASDDGGEDKQEQSKTLYCPTGRKFLLPY